MEPFPARRPPFFSGSGLKKRQFRTQQGGYTAFLSHSIESLVKRKGKSDAKLPARSTNADKFSFYFITIAGESELLSHTKTVMSLPDTSYKKSISLVTVELAGRVESMDLMP